MTWQRVYTAEEYKQLSQFDRLCASLALVEERGLQRAYFALLQLGENIQPLPVDAYITHRDALLMHIGRLAVECGISVEDLESLREMKEGRVGGLESFSKSEDAIVTSTPRPSLNMSDLKHDEFARFLQRDDTFGESSAFHSTIPELFLTPPSFTTSPPRVASAPHLRDHPSFQNDKDKTVTSAYLGRPRSLTSRHSLRIDVDGERIPISHPIRLLPYQPLSPGDMDIPKVNSYPQPGLGQRIRKIASKLSFRSIRSDA